MHSTQQAAVSQATVGQSTSLDKPTSTGSSDNNKPAKQIMPFLLPGADALNSPAMNEFLFQLSQNSDIVKSLTDRQSTTPVLTLEQFVQNNIDKLATDTEKRNIRSILYKLLTQYQLLKDFSSVLLSLKS